MKKPTSSLLAKRLTQYSALSVAIAGVTDGNSQTIVHVDLSPNYIDGGIDATTPSTWLNLNSDSLSDFYFQGLSAPGAIVKADPGSNSFLADNYGYPFALNDLDPINSSQASWFNAYTNIGVLDVGSCFGGYGLSHWCGANNQYLGVRFKIGAETHYGWVKLDVNDSGSSFTIKEYAYVEEADTGLTAGQMPLGVDDHSFSKIRVVGLNKSIGLYNLPESSNYAGYNMTGNEVLKGSTDQHDYVIEVPALSSGIYIVELSDANSNAVLRKKVVLR